MTRIFSIQTMYPIVCVAVATLLCGCTSTGGVSQPSGPETVASEKALALPPPGGPAIVGVVETKHSNGVEQNISLFTSSSVPGQNFLKIQFFGAPGGSAGSGAAQYRQINEVGVIREAFRAVPGVRMARVGTVLQNSYGPFAYASGRSATGDTCIYAWQQLRGNRSAETTARYLGMIQVRLRLCDAHASERQLLGVFYGYTITGTLVGEIWNPLGPAPGAATGLGQSGAPIYPDEGGYRAYKMPIGYEPPPVMRSAPPSGSARRSPVRAAAPQPSALPAPIGPRVPLPNLDAGSSSAAPTPQASPAAPPAKNMQSTAPASVTVPSPFCQGGGAQGTACAK